MELSNYQPPTCRLHSIELFITLHETASTVTSRLEFEWIQPDTPLVLYGEDLELQSILLDGEKLADDRYHLASGQLTVIDLPLRGCLQVCTRINPQANTRLEGLYLSGGIFCTQCEAEGFRRITYFPDRPDILTLYTTTLEADKKRYPVLLANGNPIDSGDLENGRHWARWHDPFPKPSYLFALVAGDLSCLEDQFTTASGRHVQLFIYAKHPYIDRCHHAMASLKRAMYWDEQQFGREYDLDRYMIVAVDDFNMGAMENKGLNIFNTKYVLTDPETATDADYRNVEGVIAHEYFHNWSGNRVTLRDWFQLSLKEGFTVYRDQEFSAAMGSAAVKRINDVNVLRTYQFREDASPLAHPVRPQSYVEINNFYTLTVYNKGAEVVRMVATLLGEAAFRAGCDCYFDRHDGQAVTVEDFLAAMTDSSGVDLSLFKRWYEQSGTPEVEVEQTYAADTRELTLTLRQHCPPTPGQAKKLPFLIPIRCALFAADGQPVPVSMKQGRAAACGSKEIILRFAKKEQQYTFQDVAPGVVPSLLRGFSAPIQLKSGHSEQTLAFLARHETDAFNRWEACQQLATIQLLSLEKAIQYDHDIEINQELLKTLRTILTDETEDPALRALALTLPAEVYLAEQIHEIDPTRIHAARQLLRQAIATALRDDFLKLWPNFDMAREYRFTAPIMAKRALCNTAMDYLLELQDEALFTACLQQYTEARNMNQRLSALAGLTRTGAKQSATTLHAFYQQWRHNPLVLDKWFALQASAPLPSTLDTVSALLRHPDFAIGNPNRVRSVIGSFTQLNPLCFHDPSGAGYQLLSDFLLQLDPVNPQTAARLAQAFTRWRKFEPGRREKMRTVLDTLAGHQSLSKDLTDVLSRSLADC